MLMFVDNEDISIHRTHGRWRCWAHVKMIEGGTWRVLFTGDWIPTEEFITSDPFIMFNTRMENWIKVVDEKFQKNS